MGARGLPLLFTVDLASDGTRAAVTRLGAVGKNRWVAGTARHLALYDDRGKVIHDLSPPKERGAYLENHVFATTSGIFVCAEADETAVYVAKTGEAVHRWRWRFAKDTAVAPDGSFAVVLTSRGQLNVLDLKSGRVRHRLAHPTVRGADGWCAIGPGVAASSWGEAVRLWDLHTGKPIATLKHAHRRLEMTPDGSRVLTYTPKGFAVWNVATGKRVVQRFPVVNTADPALVLDLQTRLLRPRGPGDLPHFLPRSRNEPWVDARTRVSTNEPEVLVQRFDEAETPQVIARCVPPLHEGSACRVALTHDRRIVLVSDHAARVYAFGLPWNHRVCHAFEGCR